MFLLNFLLMITLGFYSLLIHEHPLVLTQKVEEPLPAVSQQELKCLADNLYHEARSEGFDGMLAVANVTLNRVAHRSFPGSVCDVVYQPFQFSWTLLNLKIRESENYHRAILIARHVLETKNDDITEGSLYFHTVSIKRPTWTKKLTQTMIIGNHIFYRES